ncbi:hybrid sensor histidine kinase/response regulator [Vibrio coralliilyticus]|uniref:PAS domain-containing hybrid sensor histidine kinase/response regulator n=2 Tax=Vibrionaceae TaxID=641 RepID=UPI002074AF7E|nr:PAS domain-containing hybrid sensor histidine kinase/response regulator [Vibrio sp. SCSIO 43145]USD33848.1 PAS domain S-box protein [Vibrio sp. SCSIO 43186]USD46948.1 PAS domain S-box protein [Vibrio sp. SCSIO 43145]USD70972.1 PAS domain S-box protein [Vibrio sp. SCSIO 43139]USD95878.1 hybrid sensor histidine kinase/response regulator [Vibrio coralliilyticus]
MLKFDKKNGMHLFSLFLIVGACVFMLASFAFVQHQARETAQILINESLKGKFVAIERYVLEFLKLHEQRLGRVTSHPVVTRAVLEGVDNRSAFKDQLDVIKSSGSTAYVNIYDFSGGEIYQEIALPDTVLTFITTGVENESLMDEQSYSLFKYGGRDYLLLTSPILYNDYAEGLGTYVTPLDESQFFESLGTDSLHWFGIAQNRLNWEMSPPNNWKVDTFPIEGTELTLMYSVSPQLVVNARSNLMESLFIGMLTATGMTLIVMFIFGRRVLVSPFLKLAESEQRLYKQSESLKIREAESARLARVVKHMRDAVVFTDLNAKVTWVNGAFEQLTGYSLSELVGKKPSQLLQGADTDRQTTKKMRDFIDRREPGFFELLNYNKDGESYWIEIALTPLYSTDGQIEGFMAVERDITQRVELEESLKIKAVEAEAANIAKSQFLAAMSHELRTPMNGILGVGDLLKNTNLSQEQQEYVDTLVSSGKHMLNVLNDILDFSKIEAGKLELEKTEFSLQDVATRLTRLYEPLCADKHLEFKCTYPQSSDKALIADETRILQILQNLLSNALKFTSEGGISLTLDVVKQSQKTELHMVVADTGIGISSEKQSVIFDPFAQAENDTTRRFGGTGLGLSITRDLVKAMKGTIDLNSTVEEGSQFTVIVPIELKTVQVRQTHEKQEQLPEFDGSGLSVLIAEDTRVNALVLGKFLKNKGFEYEVVENGELAVERVQNQHFDCVLMDNHMPVMDGLKATKAIVELGLTSPPVIIGCTADAFEQTRERMISAGCADVITKPISSDKLDEVFHATLKTLEEKAMREA